MPAKKKSTKKKSSADDEKEVKKKSTKKKSSAKGKRKTSTKKKTVTKKTSVESKEKKDSKDDELETSFVFSKKELEGQKRPKEEAEDIETEEEDTDPQDADDLEVLHNNLVEEVEDTPVEVGPTNDDKINSELTQIYENKDGSMPDMRHFEKKRKHRIIRAFVTLVISFGLLGGVAYAGFFFFEPQLNFSQSDVIFSVRGDEEIMSGEEVRFRILYRNAQTVPLAQSSLRLRYPEGFVFEGASQEAVDEMNEVWEIGTLDPGAGDYIDVWGRLYGSIGEEQSLRAFLNYRPANFSSDFQKIEAFTVEVTEPTVDIELSVPEEVPIGSETEITITVVPKQESTGPLVVTLDPPTGFIKKSSEPESDDNIYEWSFNDITQEETIVILGTFGEGDAASIAANALQWKDESRAQEGYVVGQDSKDVRLVSTDLTANLVINGTLSNFAVQPGDTLNTSIIVKNTGETPLENLAATIVYDAPSLNNISMLDWAEVSDDADGTIVGEQLSPETRRGSITWNRFQIPDFASLAPGDEVVIDVALPIKTIDQMELTQLATSEIQAFVDVQFDKDGEREILSSNQMTMVVNSDVALDVQHEIQENKHTMRWIVTNAFHDLESLVLEADLFGDITWLEDELVVPAGEAVYDEEAQTIVWTIDQMPTSLDVLALQFAVETGEINPSQTNLSSKIRFTAFDTVTEETITLVGDEVLVNVPEE